MRNAKNIGASMSAVQRSSVRTTVEPANRIDYHWFIASNQRCNQSLQLVSLRSDGRSPSKCFRSSTATNQIRALQTSVRVLWGENCYLATTDCRNTTLPYVIVE